MFEAHDARGLGFEESGDREVWRYRRHSSEKVMIGREVEKKAFRGICGGEVTREVGERDRCWR